MKSLILGLATCTVLAVGHVSMLANASGQFGRTSPSSGGCGTPQCHGGTANTATAVSFVGLSDSIVVTPGSVTMIDVVVAHATAAGAGINVAFKTTATGGQNPSSGGLQAVTDGGLRLSGAELAHFTPLAMTQGQATFSFQLTAPTEPGLYFLRAVGNAVNLSGTSIGDIWNFAPVLRVRVSITDDVHDLKPIAAHDAPTVDVAPLPAHDQVTLTAETVPGSAYHLSVLDLTGMLIFSDVVSASDPILRYVWNGTTNTGIQAPNGSYVVAISGGGRVQHGRAVIAR